MDPGKSARQTWNAFIQAFPMIIGIVLLISLITAAIPTEYYSLAFTGNALADSFIGDLLGSVAGGNPITSYIIGGELLYAGVPLVAVTAFILSWVTVGLITLPAEIELLGKRFAIARNLFSFFIAIPVSVATVLILGMSGVQM